MIPRSKLHPDDAERLDDAARRARGRRAANKAAGLCVNSGVRGPSHGPATHGVLCEACRLVHRGRGEYRGFISVSAAAFEQIRNRAHRAGRTIRAVLDETITDALDEEERRN